MLRLLIGLAMVLAMVLVMLAAPAQAQKGRAPSPPSPEELDKKRQEEAVDQQYKSTLKRTNTDSKPARVDPWANVRGSDSAKR